jgi:predicted nucleic acid-binding protein
VTIRAILDTNVVVSAVFWKGAPFEILKAWHERRFRFGDITADLVKLCGRRISSKLLLK